MDRDSLKRLREVVEGIPELVEALFSTALPR
jgi:hypothetical protein